MRLITLIFLSSFHFTLAQNPIIPAGVYIADPTARVWEDGKLYIYGSLDESTEYYCSWRHHVLGSCTFMVPLMKVRNTIVHGGIMFLKQAI
jgi:hypothetical protein